MTMLVDPTFWNGKRVFLTGHTGFKGSWMSLWLASMGAKVCGYALAPNTQPNLFEVAGVAAVLEENHFADICDREQLTAAMVAFRPDIVIHMAAQALVRYSYAEPVETYATNVMGTVHVLDAVRQCNGVRAALMVTSDKCYQNNEWPWGYRENEPMGGYDPYSNSKGCAELVTSAYRQSFFPAARHAEHGVAVGSGRAGNVIGGGDWSADRLVPDAIAAFEKGVPLILRNPAAVRPWQHVLEPVSGYLVLAQALFDKGPAFEGGWNFGPGDDDVRSVRGVVELVIEQFGNGARWQQDDREQPHEAHLLKLDCSKAKQYLGWQSSWPLPKGIEATVAWHRAYANGQDMQQVCHAQIQDYVETARRRVVNK
jgi:CDP-glucose 4,6-dehydratase